MKAVILTKNNTQYVSPIFAIKYNGWGTKVVIFDENFQNLIYLSYWKPRRNVFVFKSEPDNWIKKDELEGYNWLVNNKKLLNKLRWRKEIPIKNFSECKNFNINEQISEWNKPENKKDIDALVNYLSLRFHDANIEKIEKNDNDLFVLFNTNWGCFIELKFVNVMEISNIEDIEYIFNANIETDENFIKWVMLDGFSKSTREQIFENVYITAKQIEWKLTI